MGKMYNRNETARLIGISRQTLDRYQEEKLLLPTKKENHTCLYDEWAIEKLQIIEIFRQAGYKRLEIKDLLENKQQLIEEYDVVIEKLEEQVKMTQGRIIQLKMIKETSNLLINYPDFLDDINYDTFYNKIGFSQLLRENDKILGESYSEFITEDAILKISEIVFSFLRLVTPSGRKLPDEEVRQLVKKSYDKFKRSFQMDSDVKEYDECKWGEFYLEFLDEVFTEDVIRKQEEIYGEGCMDFVFEAIKKFFKHLRMEINMEEDHIE